VKKKEDALEKQREELRQVKSCSVQVSTFDFACSILCSFGRFAALGFYCTFQQQVQLDKVQAEARCNSFKRLEDADYTFNKMEIQCHSEDLSFSLPFQMNVRRIVSPGVPLHVLLG